ncbi:hypothetical protein [Saccharothrix sp. S26]|nr:hypothetical protein [Saccharothrix sp. S26]
MPSRQTYDVCSAVAVGGTAIPRLTPTGVTETSDCGEPLDTRP